MQCRGIDGLAAASTVSCVRRNWNAQAPGDGGEVRSTHAEGGSVRGYGGRGAVTMVDDDRRERRGAASEVVYQIVEEVGGEPIEPAGRHVVAQSLELATLKNKSVTRLSPA